MIKKVLVVGISLLISLSAPAACELPEGEVIKVGCSYNCDFFYRFRVTMTGFMMGYSTKIINLQKRPDMRKAMTEVDGILLPGGADIDPKYYLDSVSPELQEYTRKNLNLVNFTREGLKRDSFEYNLVKLYSEDNHFKDVPMLGVCRGLQMMSVVQGIPLYLDIKTELGIRNRRNLFDRIKLEDANSLIQSVYSSETFKGFKLHHQGIRIPYYDENISKYPNTKITAYSNDRKIAEAIEYTHRPALGVQYHPERSFSGTSVPVFKWFLTKACEYKTSRKD
jgi:gamma-glutamyl-gamma-aminobutyrate hydrolase PuuD